MDALRVESVGMLGVWGLSRLKLLVLGACGARRRLASGTSRRV